MTMREDLQRMARAYKQADEDCREHACADADKYFGATARRSRARAELLDFITKSPSMFDILVEALDPEAIIMSDRKAANTALAKVLAYQQCGQQDKAKEWLRVLIRDLGYKAAHLVKER